MIAKYFHTRLSVRVISRLKTQLFDSKLAEKLVQNACEANK